MPEDTNIIELNIKLRHALGDVSPRQAASVADIAMQWSRNPQLPVDTTQAGLEAARLDDFWKTLEKHGLATVSVPGDGVQRDVNVHEATNNLIKHLGDPFAEGLQGRAASSLLLVQDVYTQLRSRLLEEAQRANGAEQEFLTAAEQHAMRVLAALRHYREALEQKAHFID